jgi:hypothetical protein
MLREKVGNELDNILAVRNRCHFCLLPYQLVIKIQFYLKLVGCTSSPYSGDTNIL